ncbi:hypothetical protein [Niabella drilacis]|uniref:Uncharacterized protein n=1 Tax=Niabella drilacis (strain DSM 25811 / CCM 8410 / CCUG 62505 / LMG 26954 / E90) TaxID=1285928 RepID=A0A1G6V329_NIADE|nr:hypothetical protein [Niabella drilacis]SDD47891.1 hypothetical protein SAMN04487894_109173 [Niabella drilacis]
MGWIMLVVFTIGVTPRIYLHDAFTHHKDQLFSGVGTHQKSIGTFEYSCGFINIETTVPFLEADPFPEPVAPAPVNEFLIRETAGPFFRTSAPVTLRGPPSI